MTIKTVKMTKSQRGSPDGFTVINYEKGETYDLPAELADVFVKQLKCAKAAKREVEKPEDNKAGPAEKPEKGKKPETPETPK